MLLECQDMIWGVLRLCEGRSLGNVRQQNSQGKEAKTVSAFGNSHMSLAKISASGQNGVGK